MRLRSTLGLSAGAAGEPARCRRAGRGAAGLNESTVRLAAPGDATAIGDLHVRSWQAAYRGIVPDAVLDGLSSERRSAFWARSIAGVGLDPPHASRIWVTEQHGTVVGFASTGPSRDEGVLPGTGEIQAIYLATGAWSRGLGSALLARAVDDLRARGFDSLVLWVLEANDRGRRFYERAGWRPDGARKPIDFDGIQVDEIRYRLTWPDRPDAAADRARVPSSP